MFLLANVDEMDIRVTEIANSCNTIASPITLLIEKFLYLGDYGRISLAPGA